MVKNLTDKDSIRVRIMKDKYIKNNNFFRMSKKKGDSIIWKKVINYRKIYWSLPKIVYKRWQKSLLLDKHWIYMLSFIYFVEEDCRHEINWDVKVMILKIKVPMSGISVLFRHSSPQSNFYPFLSYRGYDFLRFFSRW